MARTYAEQPVLLIGAALLIFVPLGLVDVLDERFQHPFEDVDPGDVSVLEWITLAGAAALHGAFAMFGDVFYAGVIAAAVGAMKRGEDHSLAHIARTLPYWRLIAVDVALALIVGVGIVLLIAPGIFLLGRLALVAPAVEVEDRGVRGAMRRSWDLVRGNTVRVLVLVVPILLFEDALTTAVQSGALFGVGDSLIGDWLAATATDLVSRARATHRPSRCARVLPCRPPRWSRRPRRGSAP